MSKTFSLIKTLSLSTIILGAFWMFGKVGTGVLYMEYDSLWSYRRLHPDLLPDAKTEKVMSIGHEATYADIAWIKLIQFIGDNIGNSKYLDFTHTILSNITELHPYFIRAYEMDLLMAPFLYPDTPKEELTKWEGKIRDILAHGERGITILCDEKKLQTIANTPMGNTLWNNPELKNPCLSGMIPYYLGYHYSNDLHDGTKAEYYYKIASMQDDAPKASQFLAILAKSTEGDYRDSALSFLLIGADGYDIEPFACQQTAAIIAKGIIEKRPLNETWIGEIGKLEAKLTDTKDTKHPESYATNNCFDSTERGIKQLYIGYVVAVAKNYPDITDSRELIKEGVISQTPTIQSQKDFYLVQKNDGIWKYKTDNPMK